MSNKKNLGTIWDELNAVRYKIQSLNEMEMTWSQTILKGDISMNRDIVHGQNILKMQLETEFENLMSEFEKLL